LGLGSLSEPYGAHVTFAFEAFEKPIYMLFEKAWLDRLRPIGKGTRITVRGTITGVSRLDLHLTNCEIIKLGA
jgi:hypothetical protein